MMARKCNELDTADECSILLKEKRPLKNENGLKKTEKKASSGGSSSLASCNNKEPAFTLITKFAAQDCSLFVPKYKLMPLLILVGIILLSGANGQGVDVQREYFRSITIATSETKVATFPVPTPVDGSNFLIFDRDGNNPISYTCSPEFMAVNKTCSLEMGDKTKTECEGLQISENGNRTHLAVEGSKLTHDHTAFCIIQQFPGLQALYTLEVFKIDNENPVISGCPSDQSVNTGSCNAKALVTWTPPTATDNSGTQTLTSTDNPGDYFPIGNNTVTYTSTDTAGNTDTCTFCVAVTDINECASNPCQNEGVCVDGLDSFTCNCAKGFNGVNCEMAPETNHYKVAFFILLSIVLLILLVIAIVIKKNFPCIPAWLKKISMERVPTKDPDQDQNTTVLHDLERNASTA